MKSTIKKLVAVITCASVIAGLASVSNAYSINSGSTATVGTKYATYGYHAYEYKVSYVLFDGMPVGAYTSGLKLKVDSNNVCTINTSQKSGNYQAFSTGTHTYRLENNSGKHVAITFNKLNY